MDVGYAQRWSSERLMVVVVSSDASYRIRSAMRLHRSYSWSKFTVALVAQPLRAQMFPSVCPFECCNGSFFVSPPYGSPSTTFPDEEPYFTQDKRRVWKFAPSAHNGFQMLWLKCLTNSGGFPRPLYQNPNHRSCHFYRLCRQRCPLTRLRIIFDRHSRDTLYVNSGGHDRVFPDVVTLSDFTVADTSDDEPPIDTTVADTSDDEFPIGDPTVAAPHEAFYFEDGTVEVLCGSTLFRVHPTILSLHSPALRRMFSRTSLDAAESPDGCPCVLSADTAADFATLLKTIYLPG
jgi:hypothetical protein